MPRHRVARPALVILGVLVLPACASDLGGIGGGSGLVPGLVEAIPGGPVTLGATCDEPSGDAAGVLDLTEVGVERAEGRVDVSWVWSGPTPSGSTVTWALVLAGDDGVEVRRLVLEAVGDEVSLAVVDADGATAFLPGELVRSSQSWTVFLDGAAVEGLGDGAWRTVLSVDGVVSDRCPEA